LLESFRLKRICFFGDSLSKNNLKAFESQLVLSNVSFTHSVTGKGGNGQILKIPSIDAGIEQIEFYQIKLSEDLISSRHYRDVKPKMMMTHTQIEDILSSCNSSIFSIGLHYGQHTSTHVSTFTHILKWIKNALEADMRHSSKRHFYRLTYPQHFLSKPPYNGELPSGDYMLADSKKCIQSSDRHWSDLLAVSVFKNSTVSVLDYYNVLKNAGRFHSVINPEDCSHYCWNQHIWRPLWGLLAFAFSTAHLNPYFN